MKNSLFKDFQLIDTLSAKVILKKWYQFSFVFYKLYKTKTQKMNEYTGDYNDFFVKL